MEDVKPKLLITGLTGYLGSWVGKYAIEQCSDKFTIRASCRSIKKAQAFKECYGEDLYSKIEWVQADLTDNAALNQAVEGCLYILHVASPIPSSTTKVSNDEIVKMAVDGMRTILKACKQYKVKKLIVTSSCATINGSSWKGKANPHYTDDDFAFGKPGQRLDGYMQSKVMQEQECINWLKENQETEIVTLHPSFIVGPCLNNFASSSVEGVKKLSDGSIPVVPQLHLPTIDIRDCAQAHINALLAPAGSLQGKRFAISQDSFWFRDLLGAIHDHFHDKGLTKIARREVGSFVLGLAAPFDQQVALIYPLIGLEVYVSNQKSRDELGMVYNRDLKQSMVEMAQSMLDHGILVPTQGTGGCIVF